MTAGQISWVIGRADPERPKAVLVAEADGAIVGSAYLRGAPPLPGLLLNVEVDPDYRRRGIGTRLLEAADAAAGSHGLPAAVSVLASDSGSLAFAARHGFVERDRRSESKLDLTTFDVDAFAEILEGAAARGIRFTVMADIDTPDMRRRLFALANQVTGDMPSIDPMEPLTYDQFVASWLEAAHSRPDLLVIGFDREAPVAVSMVTEFPGGMAYNWMTGVMPSHRGLGLGLAAKVEALRRAKASGIAEVWTENHNRNAPMLAINARLGYQPMPEVIQLVRGRIGRRSRSCLRRERFRERAGPLPALSLRESRASQSLPGDTNPESETLGPDSAVIVELEGSDLGAMGTGSLEF